jgi:phage gp16-like protein
MLLTADQHARIAARLRAKASQRKLAPLELLRLLEIAQRFEALSARVRVLERNGE